MNLDKLFEQTKGRMNTVGWHYNKWSSKCDAFFSIYKAISEHAYPIKSILNVGVGPNMESLAWNTFLKEIWPSVETFHNLEITKTNAEKARKHPSWLINQVTVGDIKKIDEYFGPNSFDLIFWNQGPEHIYREEHEDCFSRLSKVASRAIYIHCPWGSGYDGDIWHFSKSIRVGEFEAHGFDCKYHGVEDTTDAGIMGYKLV